MEIMRRNVFAMSYCMGDWTLILLDNNNQVTVTSKNTEKFKISHGRLSISECVYYTPIEFQKKRNPFL